MADIRPFRGIRFNEARFGDLSSVMAPPYDVIGPEELKLLHERSDRNVVRLILGDRLPKPGVPGQYSGSAQLLDDWLGDETLVQDRAPALYVLEQAFTVAGERRVRRAVIARLRLEVFGRGSVFPHEQTMPGPKADRLALMRATRMNMSQVFGLYPDDGTAGAVLDEISGLEPVGRGTGIDGVESSVRAVYHPGLIERLVGVLNDKRIIIADGHHRYETGIAYRDEQRLLHVPPTYEEAYEFIGAALVAMDDPGLAIQPTHRLISGLTGFDAGAFFEQARASYEVEEVAQDGPAIVARLAELAERHAFGVIVAGGARVLVRRDGRRSASGSARDLDVHLLHQELLGEMLMLGPDSWKKGGPVNYVQEPQACIDAVNDGQAQLAVIVNPTRMDEVEAVALAGATMPPKSTFFYPKIPTGAVINPLI